MHSTVSISPAEHREVGSCRGEQACDRPRGLARAFVERPRAAHPEQELGRLLAGLQHPDVQAFGPVHARAGRLGPRVLGGTFDAAEHGARLGREARLRHHQVTAQVDDRVDVLDVDGALTDTRAARDAVPDHLVAHRVRHERLQLDDARPVRGRQDRRCLRGDLVAELHDQQLRAERLAGRPRRTDLLAAPALRAREQVEQLWPGQVGGGGGTEPDLGLGGLEIDLEPLELAAGGGLGGPHVRCRGDDVQVLRGGKVDEEAEHHQQV